MYSTVPHQLVSKFIADPDCPLSIVNLGDAMLDWKGPEKSYYVLNFPSFSQTIHLSNPDAPTDKNAVISVTTTFREQVKSLGDGSVVKMGVLRTNNPILISAIEAKRKQEFADTGIHSILDTAEMLEQTQSVVSKAVEQAVAKALGEKNELIGAHVAKANKLEQENAKLRALLAAQSSTAEPDAPDTIGELDDADSPELQAEDVMEEEEGDTAEREENASKLARLRAEQEELKALQERRGRKGKSK